MRARSSAEGAWKREKESFKLGGEEREQRKRSRGFSKIR